MSNVVMTGRLMKRFVRLTLSPPPSQQILRCAQDDTPLAFPATTATTADLACGRAATG